MKTLTLSNKRIMFRRIRFYLRILGLLSLLISVIFLTIYGTENMLFRFFGVASICCFLIIVISGFILYLLNVYFKKD